jgi:actin-like ATPase involved in cell morphogenesis
MESNTKRLISDPEIPNYPKIYGVKIGSKYTVTFDGSSRPKVELTCLRRKPIDLMGNETYEFSAEAVDYSNTLYPLKQGVPRNDVEMSIAESIRHTKRYTDWLFRDFSEDAGIVVCLPLIRDKEGLEALKSAIRGSTSASRGIQFYSEARGAALGTIPIKEAIGTNVLVVNFGSSTVEVAFHAMERCVEHNVYTFGGSDIDKRLMNAIMQEYRGTECSEDNARKIKELYSWADNNDIEFTLTLEGAKHELSISGSVVRRIVSNAIDRLVALVRNQFLRAAEMSDRTAVSSLQAAGKGYLVLCGGMINMPGFSQELYNRLVGVGAINENVKLAIPDDGVTAPAIGAYKIGQVLEQIRVDEDLETWEHIVDTTTED